MEVKNRLTGWVKRIVGSVVAKIIWETMKWLKDRISELL